MRIPRSPASLSPKMSGGASRRGRLSQRPPPRHVHSLKQTRGSVDPIFRNTAYAVYTNPQLRAQMKKRQSDGMRILILTEHSLYVAHCVPGTVVKTAYILIHLILTLSL